MHQSYTIYIYISLLDFKILCTTILLLKTIISAKVPRYHNWVVCFSNVPVKMGVEETFRSIDICINYIFHSIWMQFSMRCSQRDPWKHNVSFTDNFFCFYGYKRKYKVCPENIPYLISPPSGQNEQFHNPMSRKYTFLYEIYHNMVNCNAYLKFHIIDVQLLECCPSLTVVVFFFLKTTHLSWLESTENPLLRIFQPQLILGLY